MRALALSLGLVLSVGALAAAAQEEPIGALTVSQRETPAGTEFEMRADGCTSSHASRRAGTYQVLFQLHADRLYIGIDPLRIYSPIETTAEGAASDVLTVPAEWPAGKYRLGAHCQLVDAAGTTHYLWMYSAIEVETRGGEGNAIEQPEFEPIESITPIELPSNDQGSAAVPAPITFTG